jgi:hypothetical protein
MTGYCYRRKSISRINKSSTSPTVIEIENTKIHDSLYLAKLNLSLSKKQLSVFSTKRVSVE